ncbi:MAG: hypothetical protein ABII93_06080 [Chrysiogenia bacterium]
MWPFKKKTDNPEPAKPEINIEATKRMLEKKAAAAQKETAPDDPKPITSGEKLECPSCKQLIEKYSKRSKCPLCKNWVHYFNGRLYTPEKSRRVKDEFYSKRYQNRAPIDFGFTEEMMQQREQKMVGTSGMKTSRASVFMSLFNEKTLTVMKTGDMRELERLYMEAAQTLDRMGKDSFGLQKSAALTRLAALKLEKFKKVYILSQGNCDACRELDGKVMTIEEAEKTMPIPIREGCNNRGEGDKYSICVCFYNGKADDEYIKSTL